MPDNSFNMKKWRFLLKTFGSKKISFTMKLFFKISVYNFKFFRRWSKIEGAMDKREEIKVKARGIFLRYGFHKANMDDIARAVRISKPTLYYYFRNKEEIFEEILLEEAERILDRARNEVQPNEPADVKLRQFFMAIYHQLEHLSSEIKQHDEYLLESSPHGKPMIDKMKEMVSFRLKPILEEGIRNGIFRPMDPDRMVQAIMLTTFFLHLIWIRSVSKKERDQQIEDVLNILLNGLKGGKDA